jgi:polygalacturonase
MSRQSIFARFLPVLFIFLSACTKEQSFDITEYGANGDGKTLNTEAIQEAIDQCAETGGTVLVPEGTFLTGSIHLRENVMLYLSEGAVLKGSPDMGEYEKLEIGFYALIMAENAENTGISGPGTIDGNGAADDFHGYDKRTEKSRPVPVYFYQCQNVVAKDFTLINSPVWAQRYHQCTDVRISKLKVNTNTNAQNDGLDLVDCRNVVLSDCIIDSGDDALCLKSESAGLGCANIAITNCVLSTHCNAIKFGTASLGGFRNVSISNCVVKPSAHDKVHHGWRSGLAGIALEMVDGGVMDNVSISNMNIEGVMAPIFIRLGRRTPAQDSLHPTQLKNITISNISCSNDGKMANSITAYPGAVVENVMISDISFKASGGGTTADAQRNLKHDSLAALYPEVSKFGASLPAYGFYLYNVKNISLDNIKCTADRPDARPVIVAENADGLVINALQADAPTGRQGLIRTKGAKNSHVQNTRPLQKTAVMVKAAQTDQVRIGNYDRNMVGIPLQRTY